MNNVQLKHIVRVIDSCSSKDHYISALNWLNSLNEYIHFSRKAKWEINEAKLRVCGKLK